LREAEDFARGAWNLSYETMRRWLNRLGLKIASELRKRRHKPHAVGHLDEGRCHIEDLASVGA
jgi:hypothetical protein